MGREGRPQTPLEQVVERWWNGEWGPWNRRDLWLRTDGVRWWQVQVRMGHSDRPSVLLNYAPDEGGEAAARSQLRRLLSERGPWRLLS